MILVAALALLGVSLADGGRAQAQTPRLTPAQSQALADYEAALARFRAVLKERRAQIDARRPLPNLPGQALYLARIAMMGTYKDLTDVMPSKIGKPNKFGIPPAYFDAANEPLIDEYVALFGIMQAGPANAQNSATPFEDVVTLSTVIARAKGLDAATADVAGRIGLGIFFAETNGNQNIGNARSNRYKGSFQTGIHEARAGQRRWDTIKARVAALDAAVAARDAKEEARLGSLDRRFNHWIAVRDGLMNAHADLFPRIPSIIKTLPNPIDQMKVFQLIQIVPSPTRAALASGDFVNYRVSDPRIMRFLRNNSMFAFGKADRAKTSANYREILDAMWLFNEKFERAIARFEEIKGKRGR